MLDIPMTYLGLRDVYSLHLHPTSKNRTCCHSNTPSFFHWLFLGEPILEFPKMTLETWKKAQNELIICILQKYIVRWWLLCFWLYCSYIPICLCMVICCPHLSSFRCLKAPPNMVPGSSGLHSRWQLELRHCGCWWGSDKSSLVYGCCLSRFSM